MKQNKKIFCMFAMRNIHKGGRTRLILLLVAGFFISVTQIYGSVPPREVLMNSQPLWCYAEGKAEPLFYSAQQTNICKMRNTENTCLKGNNSTQQATSNSTRTVKPLTQRLSETLQKVDKLDEPYFEKHFYLFEILKNQIDYTRELIEVLVPNLDVRETLQEKHLMLLTLIEVIENNVSFEDFLNVELLTILTKESLTNKKTA